LIKLFNNFTRKLSLSTKKKNPLYCTKQSAMQHYEPSNSNIKSPMWPFSV